MSVTFRKKIKGAPFTIRLSHRHRFGLDLLARTQGRNHSAVIEKALEREIAEGLALPEQGNMLDFLWDPDEADRFVLMAQHFPRLLTYQEEIQWKEIRETERFWRGGKPNLPAIRREYEDLKQRSTEKAEE